MDTCPSLPLKILTAELRLPDRHTPRMAAVAGRLVVCSLYVQLVNIGIVSFTVRNSHDRATFFV